MEIETIVLKGAVRHEDNLGNTEITSVGEVQRMSGGSGIIHAEYNASEKEPTRFLQLWFMPNQLGLQSSYETSKYEFANFQNRLHAIKADACYSQRSAFDVVTEDQ
ncbi:pirin family protein [Paenibacillus sp. TAF58]